MPISLEFTPPFEPGIFAFLAARAVAGVEEASATSYSRTLALSGGHAWFKVTWTGATLLLDCQLEDENDVDALVGHVRHLLNLGHDPIACDAALANDALLATRIVALPGMRLPGCVDAAEILIRAMIGQQITVAAARTALNQLAALSTQTRMPSGSMVRFFPTPAQIAAGGASILRGPKKRIDSVLRVAHMLADGTLRLSRADTPATLAQKLLPIAGIGPWTVGYVGMRVLGSADIFLPSDAAVRNGYGKLLGLGPAEARGIKPSELNHFAEALQPWRSYATLHLWRVAGEKS